MFKGLRRGMAQQGWIGQQSAGAPDAGQRLSILQEELAKRRLAWLLDDDTASLTWAVQEVCPAEQRRLLEPLLADAGMVLWRQVVDQTAPDGLIDAGIRARRDGDDYVLGGQATFTGPGLPPDMLWILAAPAEAPPGEALMLLVLGNTPGVSWTIAENAPECASLQASFVEARVPVTHLMGDESNRLTLMHTAGLMGLPGLSIAQVGQAVSDLLRYARETARDGAPLSQHPVIQQVLAEAYTTHHILELLRQRDAWLRETGRTATYESAQTALLTKRAVNRFAEFIREVAGQYALLDAEDPRAPEQHFVRFQRLSVAQHLQADSEFARASQLADALRLGGPTRVDSDKASGRSAQATGTYTHR
jgi:alkylation response protein AidB-like acyl-CoA dehydrogenase